MHAYLPNRSQISELLTPISAAPIPMNVAQTRCVPRRPELSMTILAERLPRRPPIVKTEVTREKVKSDMGIHGRRYEDEGRRVGDEALQVKTACIWLRTEMW